MDQPKIESFTMALPILVTRIGVEPVAIKGTTSNVSSCEVSFTIFAAEPGPELEPDSRLHFVITLPGNINLRCMGRVLRSGPLSHGADGYAIKATLERYEFGRSDLGGSVTPQKPSMPGSQ